MPHRRSRSAPTASWPRRCRSTSRQDFEDAQRGFVATDDPLVIAGPNGAKAWDFPSYAFIEGDAPATVNPSLWRQAKLNGQHGLFEVVPGIHQVRGYDISNMTLIEGKTGWIIVDPAHGQGDGRSRDRTGAQAPRRPPCVGDHLHPQPRRSLRRGRGRAARGSRGGGEDSHRGAARLHGRSHQ